MQIIYVLMIVGVSFNNNPVLYGEGYYFSEANCQKAVERVKHVKLYCKPMINMEAWEEGKRKK